MTLDWLRPAERLSSLPPYVFARLDELKANEEVIEAYLGTGLKNKEQVSA